MYDSCVYTYQALRAGAVLRARRLLRARQQRAPGPERRGPTRGEPGVRWHEKRPRGHCLLGTSVTGQLRGDCRLYFGLVLGWCYAGAGLVPHRLMCA